MKKKFCYYTAKKSAEFFCFINKTRFAGETKTSIAQQIFLAGY